MTDIVEQLRNYGLSHLKGTPSVIVEAAAEIERLEARAEAAEKRVLPPEPTDAMLEAMWSAMFEEPFDATALPMLGAGYDALRAALGAKP